MIWLATDGDNHCIGFRVGKHGMKFLYIYFVIMFTFFKARNHHHREQATIGFQIRYEATGCKNYCPECPAKHRDETCFWISEWHQTNTFLDPNVMWQPWLNRYVQKRKHIESKKRNHRDYKLLRAIPHFIPINKFLPIYRILYSFLTTVHGEHLFTCSIL